MSDHAADMAGARFEGVHVDPDCTGGKHTACPGWTYDDQADQSVPCECACHDPNTEDPRP